jgi:hypothetical protein
MRPFGASVALRVPVLPHALPARAILSVWAATVLVGGALLVLKHQAPLPETEVSARAVEAAIGGTRATSEDGRWLVVHVLYEKCGCSSRVLEALLQHRPGDLAAERIVFVTDDGAPPEVERRARELGYGFVALSRDRLVQEYRLQSAPTLAILGPADALRYLGGYTERRRGPVLEDRNIIRRTVAGERVPPFPTLGCAVGRRLAARTNPLNL